MKSKTLLLAGILAIGITANAQESPISVSVVTGMNLSNMSIKDTDSNPRLGYQIGILGDLNYNANWFFQSGILFSAKDARDTFIGMYDFNGDGFIDEGTEKTNMSITYLQLPLYAGYRMIADDNIKINFTAGPYLGYGFIGTIKKEWRFTSGYDDNLHEGSSNCNIFDDVTSRILDLGFSGGVGIDINRILVNIGYEHGLANINDGPRISNRNAYLTVGYRFK